MEHKILIVEDNLDIRYNIKMILEMDGYEVIEAGNGKEALDKLSKESLPPELIISDIMMPEMDGYLFYEEVSQHMEWCLIPFIFLTAKASKEDIRFGKMLGVDDYITKPFEDEDLLAVVHGKFRRRQREEKASRRVREELEKKYDQKAHPIDGNIFLSSNFVFFCVVEWDESQGPMIVHTFPNRLEKRQEFEDIMLNLFLISGNVYGLHGVKEPQGITVRLPQIDLYTYIYFGGVEDESIRGGSRPYMFAVLAKQLHYLAISKIKEYFHQLIEKMRPQSYEILSSVDQKIHESLQYDMKKLNRLMIFSESGVEFLSYDIRGAIDQNFISGFFTAIQGFSQEMNAENIRSMELENEIMHFYQDPDYRFYVFGQASNKYQKDLIGYILRSIAKEFKDRFGEELEDFEGETGQFKKFKANLTKYIKQNS